MAGLQAAAQRAVAHHHQAGIGPAREHGVERAQNERHVLLRGQAAHVEQHRRVFRGVPVAAQLGTAVLGREQPRIDTAAHHLDALKAVPAQLRLQRAARHEGGGGAVVEGAQVVHHQTARERKPVVLAVHMEIGAEVAGHRHVEATRRLDGGAAERPLCCHVHQLGGEIAQAAAQRRRGGQAHAQVGIHRNAHAARAPLLRLARHALAALRRAHQQHLMPGPPHVAHATLHGQRDAVHFRRIGFGDVGDAHGVASRCASSGTIGDARSRRGAHADLRVIGD